MTYSFPEPLTELRKYLKSHGFDGNSVKTPRQAAFVAQQLLGTRIKFPPQGEDMTPTLLLIQKVVAGERPRVVRSAWQQPATVRTKGKRKGDKIPPSAKSNTHSKDFSAEVYAHGVHIFCDGASVPNPGAGGWGVVVYRDGVEIGHEFGGDADTTNNQMELTGLLVAIERAWQLAKSSGDIVTIWCDSQYCVKGVNEWMPKWKARGWIRKKPTSPKEATGEIKNLELWQAIDHALGNALITADIAIKWVKGHAGIVGNERADELAEMGRRDALKSERTASYDLDERYRQIMGAA